MKILLLLAASTTLAVAGEIREKRQSYYGRGGNSYGGNNYQGRADVQGCTVNPPGATNRDTPARQGQMVEITCNTNSEFNSCFFVHTKPFDVGRPSSHDVDTECSVSGANSQNCADDPRISISSSQTSCKLMINNPEPDDTGIWRVVISEYKNNDMTSSKDQLEIFTYNQTETLMLDEDDNEITNNYDVKYNYDDWRDRWNDGEGGFESHTLTCYSKFGRPEPKFTWSIDRTELTNDNQFRISDQTGSGYDDMGYVRDRYSEIDFEVNEYFLNNLRDNHNIDVNPESGQFTFDLTCKSEQGDNGEYNKEEVRTRITVHRTFHPDRLTNNQIGMIVGIVLGVLVLFIVGSVLLLIFAKSNEMWCFANEDYQYRDPQDKRRPVSHAQVYSDDPSSKPRPPKSKHNSNRSSGSSTERKIHPDDWIPTSGDDHSANIKQSTDPKIINYELQVKSSNSDSGLSSPASSIDKGKIVPTPLSNAKPRQTKSQQVQKANPDIAKRLSTYTSYDNMRVEHKPQVYTVDSITYADLDTKAFMIPHNKVLPSDSVKKADSSSDSRSTYAEITSKPVLV